MVLLLFVPIYFFDTMPFSVKNKGKISRRDGVFHINGKDHLFKRATGEWNWM